MTRQIMYKYIFFSIFASYIILDVMSKHDYVFVDFA